MRICICVILAVSFLSGQVPASPPEPATDIRDLLDRAVKSHSARVVIPAGEYRITPRGKDKAHIVLKDITGLVIAAEGVRLICERASRAIDIANCKDLVIRGLTIDYDPLLNTQGVVEELDVQGRTFTLKVDEGYPCSAEFGSQIQIFEPVSRLLKKDSWQMNNAQAEELPDRRLRIRTENVAALKSMAPGDLVALDRKPEGLSHAIHVKDSAHVVMEDVTLHGSPSFGVLEHLGEGGHEYRRFKITPGPKPPGAASERLRSIADDGLHSYAVTKGPLIEDCLIERHGDDGIAIHGSYHLILGGQGKTVRLALKREVDFKVGDKMMFYHPDGSHAGEARVTKIGSTRNATPQELEQIAATTWSLVTPIFKTTAEIELDTDVTLPPGGRVCPADRCGNGFVVRNNTVKNHRARGILIKASDGIIENNTIDGSSIAGIVLSPEFTWMEADFSTGVTIKGNTVRNTGSEPANPSRSQAGAISVSAEGTTNKIAPSGGHRNIVIEDNTVESCRGAGLVVTSTEHVRITGNRFDRIETGHFGSKHGISDKAIIWIDRVKDVFLENNFLPKDGGVVFGKDVLPAATK